MHQQTRSTFRHVPISYLLLDSWPPGRFGLCVDQLGLKTLPSVQNSSMIAASITDWFKSNGYDAVAANGNLIGTWARVG